MTDKHLPFLLEIGLEEVPARFLVGANSLLEQFSSKLQAEMVKQSIPFHGLHPLGTYRRLTITIDQLATVSTTETRKLKGPMAHIAKTDSGELTAAGLGFLKRYGASPDDVTFEDDGGKSYLFVTHTVMGQPVSDLMAGIVSRAIASLSLPIAMTWGTGEGPFIRPVHWIVCLHGVKIVPVTLFGIHSGRTSYGHRLLSNGPILLDSATDYIPSLLSGNVVVEPHIRTAKIVSELHTSGVPDGHADLVDEVVWLTERPQVLTGSFEATYLDVPQDVLIETMVKNQRYFPILDSTGHLTNRFAIVADNVTAANSATIIAGNERVLRARLDDAKFFWTEDLKLPLAGYTEKLKVVTFQKGLGSVWDKVERITQLSDYLCDVFGVSPENRALVLRTAALCKADLVTHMVYEFGSLQGIMGGHYARRSGEPDLVCQGIAEQYQKAITITGKIVGIADRLDTICACFGNGLIPTGSQDPWGVRRAIYEILNHVSDDTAATISFEDWIRKGFVLLGKSDMDVAPCIAFMKDRVCSYADSFGAVAAVSHRIMTDFFPALGMAEFVRVHANQEWLIDLITVATRVSKLITPRLTEGVINPDLFEHPEEAQALEAFRSYGSPSSIETQLTQAASLAAPLTHYFEAVMVMAEDTAVRQNRLMFLTNVHRLFVSMADFTEIG